LMILLAFAVLATSFVGCGTAANSVGRDCNYFCDDTVRALGLDQPSALHARDLVSGQAYEPYRGY
jgi:hypothetical protein